MNDYIKSYSETISYYLKNQFFCFLCACIFFLYAYRDTLFSLIDLWLTDDSYSHGLLLAPIIIFFTFVEIKNRGKPYLRINYSLLLIVPLCSFLWAWSRIAGVGSVEYPLFIILFYIFMRLFFNDDQKRSLFIPILFFLFATPTWWLLVPFLQMLTIYIVSIMLSIMNVTAFIEGSLVTVPSGVFIIAEGCAGVKYFLSGTILSIIIVYLSNIKTKKTVLFIVAAIFLSLVANWVRVFFIIIIGYYSNMNSGLVKEHEVFGWVVFFLMYLPIFLWSRNFILDKEKIFFKKTKKNIYQEHSFGNPEKEKLVSKATIIFLFILLGPSVIYLTQKSTLDNDTLDYPAKAFNGQMVSLGSSSIDGPTNLSNIIINNLVYQHPSYGRVYVVVGRYSGSIINTDLIRLRQKVLHSSVISRNDDECLFSTFVLNNKVDSDLLTMKLNQLSQILMFRYQYPLFFLIKKSCQFPKSSLIQFEQDASQYIDYFLTLNGFPEVKQFSRDYSHTSKKPFLKE